MTDVVDVLRRCGPMPATRVAAAAGASLEDAYAALVAAEARGMAEVRCLRRANQSAGRVWAPTFRALEDATCRA